jgi:uncharacterized protein with ParB-like and HNH nuclease domain
MDIAEQIRPKEMGDLFNQNEELRIPSYQRRYSWKEEHFEDLWNDLMRIEEEGSHFFGTLVFMSNSAHIAQGLNPIDIVDGQQRITTVSILLCAIRDHLRDGYDEEKVNKRVDNIEENLWIFDRDGEKQGMRLSLGNLDKKSYENLVKSRIDEIENERIESAYTYFTEQLENELTTLDQVKNLHDSILDQLIYVSITAKGHSDAYELFESMNNRGLTLSPIDLMKNYLLMNASRRGNSDEDRIEELWGDIITNIDSISSINNPGITFFRQYFMASDPFGISEKITTSKLYEPTFVETIDETDDIESLLKDIKNKSELYRRLLQQDINRFSDSENAEINRLLRDAGTVSKVMFTLLLRAFSESDDPEFLKKVIQKSNSLLIRRQICDRNTGPHGNIFNHLAQNAFEEEDILGYMDEYLKSESWFPSNDEFERRFKQEEFSRSDRTKYILSKIEEDGYGSGGKQVVDSRYEVHIEHILPERLGENLRKMWLEPFDISEDEHDEYRKRIGNLTLLEEGPNLRASNRSLEKKQEFYTEDKTDFRMTHEIQDEEEWGITQIEERSKKLAHMATEVWCL